MCVSNRGLKAATRVAIDVRHGTPVDTTMHTVTADMACHKETLK